MGIMSPTQPCRRQGHRMVTHLTITDKLSSTEIHKIAICLFMNWLLLEYSFFTLSFLFCQRLVLTPKQI